MLKTIATVVLALLAVGVAAPILLTLVACRSFLYHPFSSPYSVPAGWAAETLDVESQLALVGLVRIPTSTASPVILFFGGNGASLEGNRSALDLIEGTGAAVFAYRGYDGSGGEPTEEAIKSDALAVAAHLEKKHGVDPSRLVLMGQSLGSGVAAHLAAELSKNSRPPRALVLLSPYTSIARVFDEYVPLIPIAWAVADPWRTEDLVKDIRCPVLIIHGAQDTLITVEHGRELKAAFGERATMLELEHAGHNDLWSDPRTVQAIERAVGGS